MIEDVKISFKSGAIVTSLLAMAVVSAILMVPTILYWLTGTSWQPIGGFPDGIGVSWPFQGVLVDCLSGLAPSSQSCLQAPNVDNFLLGLGIAILQSTFVAIITSPSEHPKSVK